MTEQKQQDISEKPQASSGKRWKRFSKEEVKLLRENYPKIGGLGVRNLLPHRALSTIHNKAWQLGIRSPIHWTADQLAIIKQYPTLPIKEIARQTGRTPSGVRGKIFELELKGKGRRKLFATIDIHLSNFELGRLTGLVDGEGAIWVREDRRQGRPQYYPGLNVANKNRQVLEHLQGITGFGAVRGKYVAGKTVMHWVVEDGDQVYTLCNLLLDSLIVKQRQAAIACMIFQVKNRITRGEMGLEPELRRLYNEINSLNPRHNRKPSPYEAIL